MKTMVARVLMTASTAMAVVTGVVLGSAVPAGADQQPFHGVYAVEGGADGFYSVFAPNCVTEGCTATITSNRGWDSVATLTNGRWNFTVTKPDGVVCEDGNYAPVVVHYSIDAVSLQGTLTADSNGGCPGGQVTVAPFQLRKIQ